MIAPQYACKIPLIDCNTTLSDCKHPLFACNIPLPIYNIALSDWTIPLYDSKPCNNTWSIWLRVWYGPYVFFARKFGTSNNQIVCCGETDQSTTIIATVLMQTVTASVLAVHWLPTDFCVPKSPRMIMRSVKQVLLLFLFLFGRGVNVYEAYIIVFASHAQGA